MAQHLEQTQAAVQTQQLSSLQVAVAKLVELPITELSTRVRDEMLDNAALEERGGDDVPDAMQNGMETDAERDDERSSEANDDYSDGYSDNYGDTGTREADAMGDYLSPDDVPDYLRQKAEGSTANNPLQYATTTTFYEELQRQMGEHALTPHEQVVMEYLIGSLDEDGFLRKDLDTLCDELAIYHNVDTSRAELERLLATLQQFEPRGIGARSLQECLHIQLVDADHHTPYTALALAVVDRCFKDFMNRHWDVVKQRLKLSDEQFEHVRREITHLNPRPGSALSEAATQGAPVIVPDFFVQVTTEGNINVSLNRGDVPQLCVSAAFRDSLQQYGTHKANLTRQQKDAYTYAKQKVDAAQAFINLLERRRVTLLAVMRGIVQKQRAFFLADDDDDALQPLTLKEIAEMAGIDVSTVSRVTSSKYVQTAYGTYALKHFFSSQFTTADGDELSARKVKAALRTLIDAEDKKHPLSDETLAARLKAQGFNVARRTVAKYRDLLGLPTARLRKE